ncbi:MAG: hypothetical protein UZ22_OP11002000708 [Microgenomates bacterium OLB23]|nr:MAG: hypothetical protein UZ22_OP11002000708 [Microgenomates bacterium OLB23]
MNVFVLSSYVIVSLWIVSGVHTCSYGVDKLVKKLRKEHNSSSTFAYAPILLAITAIVPIYLFLSNYGTITLLTHDQTAENMAKNILNTSEKNGILLLSKDNEIFNASYIYYAQHYRPDIALF